jgi:uridine kinase
MRRGRSRAGSLLLEGDEEQKDAVIQEIKLINQDVDFDDPKQIDFDLLIKGIIQLKEEKMPFNKPVYDKFLKIRTERTVIVNPSQVLIVEGALIFCSEQLRRLIDLKVFVDCDDDVRLSRRVLKNAIEEEGPNKTSLTDLLKTYEEKTKPAFEKFIEPTKKYANTIIPNYGFSTDLLELNKMAVQGVDVIVTHVET